MTLDEVAVVAATNPDSVVGQVANIEIQRRAADAKLGLPTHKCVSQVYTE